MSVEILSPGLVPLHAVLAALPAGFIQNSFQAAEREDVGAQTTVWFIDTLPQSQQTPQNH